MILKITYDVKPCNGKNDWVTHWLDNVTRVTKSVKREAITKITPPCTPDYDEIIDTGNGTYSESVQTCPWVYLKVHYKDGNIKTIKTNALHIYLCNDEGKTIDRIGL